MVLLAKKPKADTNCVWPSARPPPLPHLVNPHPNPRQLVQALQRRPLRRPRLRQLPPLRYAVAGSSIGVAKNKNGSLVIIIPCRCPAPTVTQDAQKRFHLILATSSSAFRASAVTIKLI